MKGPSFDNNHKLWFAIWKSVNWSWEKAWSEKTEKTDPWWVGRMAGLLFQLREISGYEEGYFHGEMLAGYRPPKKGRRFGDDEFKYREKRQEHRRKNPQKFSTIEDSKEFFATEKLKIIYALLKSDCRNNPEEINNLLFEIEKLSGTNDYFGFSPRLLSEMIKRIKNM